jgi:serine/threonine-protein kinase
VIPGQIGRYEIKSELGRGGMATVYRAHDPRFKREVAVKILPREFLHDPNFRARFEREAQTIAALEHPAIVPVYDYGEEDGQPYLVMRLMTGGSLSERLANGPLSLLETSTILSRLAPALDRAHGLGIVHRDLKPGNILFDGDDNPYISDFGLAKLTQSSTQLSQTGVMGTPAYMSPEQARGDKDIDGRADLYALGAILYQMLTGRLPFEADTPIGLVLKHVTEPPPRLRDSRPDLPPACDAIVAQAMAKEPDKRFSTASRLTDALELTLDTPPATPEPEPARAPLPAPQSGEREPHSVSPAQAVPAPAPQSGEREPHSVSPAQAVPAPAPQPAIPTATVVRPQPAAPPAPSRAFSPLLIGGIVAGAAGLIAVVSVAAALFNPPAPVAPTDSPASSAPTAAIAAMTSTIAVLPTEIPAATPTPEPTFTPTPEAGATTISEIDGMPQVYVPAGEFTMGNDAGPADQQPAHSVFLESFWIDRLEVTNAHYALCVAAGLCTLPEKTSSITRAQYFGLPEYANYPVVYVSWFQAKDYCQWAGRRLPTEAEWEKAARGGDGRVYPWGSDAPDAALLNFRAAGFGDTVAVGNYAGNLSPYNAMDMAGNVSEWVEDFYDPNYYRVSPKDNPTGPAKTGCEGGDCRVLRGGNWNGTPEDVTTTFRLFYGPGDSRDAFGIRCARTP